MVTAEKVNNRMAKKSTAAAVKAPRIAQDADAKSGLKSKAATSETTAKGGKKRASASKKSSSANKAMAEQNTVLKTTLQQIERQFGEGAIMPLGKEKLQRIKGIPTGSLSLDMALGGQGIPEGRIIEIYGPESSGKTTLALHVIAESQKEGGIAAFIDAEHALDPSWAKKLGV